MGYLKAGGWRAFAGYLYVLHLDGPELAWEYLRGNPDYRRVYASPHSRPGAAQGWGLLQLEDPGLDARDVHPGWCFYEARRLQLHPDPTPPLRVSRFDLWAMPGRR